MLVLAPRRAGPQAVTTPRTEAGRALLAVEHEPKGVCWTAPDCDCADAIVLIEAEARAAVLAEMRERVEGLDRLWWCGGWGTLNAKRYHGNDGPCELTSGTCGLVAYVHYSDLALLSKEADHA